MSYRLEKILADLDELRKGAQDMCGMLPPEKAELERARLQGSYDNLRRIVLAAYVTAENGVLDLDKNELVVVVREK